jgi:hypothetical protein
MQLLPPLPQLRWGRGQTRRSAVVWVRGANSLRLKTAPPTSDAGRANAPLPEQRLKGVLDLSPGCAEGEVNEDRKPPQKPMPIPKIGQPRLTPIG